MLSGGVLTKSRRRADQAEVDDGGDVQVRGRRRCGRRRGSRRSRPWCGRTAAPAPARGDEGVADELLLPRRDLHGDVLLRLKLWWRSGALRKKRRGEGRREGVAAERKGASWGWREAPLVLLYRRRGSR